MALFRKTSEVKDDTFDYPIEDMCQYGDTIYMICQLNIGHKFSVLEYSKYTHLKFISDVVPPDGSETYMKANLNGPPELLHIALGDGLNIDIQNIFTGKITVSRFIPFQSCLNDYKCSYNVLVIIPYSEKEIFIYNIENDTLVRIDMIYIPCYNISSDSKLYFIHKPQADNIRILKSVDFITGDIATLGEFSVKDNDNSLLRDICLSYMIDGIFYCEDSHGCQLCLDTKSGRQFRSSEGVRLLFHTVINKKCNKMITFDHDMIIEYDIIVGTLFKSANIPAYIDMTIVTRDND